MKSSLFYRPGGKVKNRGEMGPDALLEGDVELVDAELPNTERGAVQTVVDPRNRLTVMWGQLKSEHR